MAKAADRMKPMDRDQLKLAENRLLKRALASLPLEKKMASAVKQFGLMLYLVDVSDDEAKWLESEKKKMVMKGKGPVKKPKPSSNEFLCYRIPWEKRPEWIGKLVSGEIVRRSRSKEGDKLLPEVGGEIVRRYLLKEGDILLPAVGDERWVDELLTDWFNDQIDEWKKEFPLTLPDGSKTMIDVYYLMLEIEGRPWTDKRLVRSVERVRDHFIQPGMLEYAVGNDPTVYGMKLMDVMDGYQLSDWMKRPDTVYYAPCQRRALQWAKTRHLFDPERFFLAQTVKTQLRPGDGRLFLSALFNDSLPFDTTHYDPHQLRRERIANLRSMAITIGRVDKEYNSGCEATARLGLCQWSGGKVMDLEDYGRVVEGYLGRDGGGKEIGGQLKHKWESSKNWSDGREKAMCRCLAAGVGWVMSKAEVRPEEDKIPMSPILFYRYVAAQARRKRVEIKLDDLYE